MIGLQKSSVVVFCYFAAYLISGEKDFLFFPFFLFFSLLDLVLIQFQGIGCLFSCCCCFFVLFLLPRKVLFMERS